jgi:hypothetical protein
MVPRQFAGTARKISSSGHAAANERMHRRQRSENPEISGNVARRFLCKPVDDLGAPALALHALKNFTISSQYSMMMSRFATKARVCVCWMVRFTEATHRW